MPERIELTDLLPIRVVLEEHLLKQGLPFVTFELYKDKLLSLYGKTIPCYALSVIINVFEKYEADFNKNLNYIETTLLTYNSSLKLKEYKLHEAGVKILAEIY